MILRVILVIIAAVLIAAHYLREGSLLLAVLCLAAPLLLLVRQRWSLLVLQGLAYLAALVWLSTMIDLILQRLAMGRSYTGVVLILGTVTLVTVLAGVLLNSNVIKARYTAVPESSPPDIDS